MNVLVLGLYVEGPTDEDFLPTIIRRTAEQVLSQHQRTLVEVLPPFVLKKKPEISDRVECILQAAREAEGYHALIIHADADNRTREPALSERFEPGYRRVQQSSEKLCKDLIPIIPVRMLEAWMLVDLEKLQEALGTSLSAHDLGLRVKARQVESYRDPKQTLDQIVKQAHPRQHRHWMRIKGDLYAQLAPEISLERLSQVPAYKQFVHDLTETMKKINVIQ